MNDQEWREAYENQNVSIRGQLAWLRADRRRWRQARQMEYVCGGCRKALLEVVRTVPYLVVIHRRTEAHPDARPPEIPKPAKGSRVADYQAHYLKYRVERGPSVRAGATRFFPIPDAEDSPGHDARTMIICACDCRQWKTTLAQVRRDLQGTSQRRVIPRPHVDTSGYDVT